MSDQTKLELADDLAALRRHFELNPSDLFAKEFLALFAEIIRLRAPVAVDAAAERKLASNERPEGIPNLPSPGWHEAIEEAAKVAENYALDQESCERLQAETICYVIRDAIRALLPDNGAWPQRAAPRTSNQQE